LGLLHCEALAGETIGLCRLFPVTLDSKLEEKMTGAISSRRSFLKKASMLAVGGIAAACAPAQQVQPEGQPQAPAQEGTLLRYWSGWGGEGYSKAWDDIQQLDGFKEALGNNTFEVKVSTGEEAMLTAIAGGDPPETGTNMNYLGFMARGVLMPISNLVSVSTKTNKSDFIEGNWEVGFYKGDQYGIPSQECFLRYGLNYNAKLVQEAGLDPNSPPETWDDLYQWHETLTQKDSAGNLTRLGVNPFGAMGEGLWDMDGWMATTSWGFEWFDDKTSTFNLNSEPMVDIFRTFKKFIDLVGPDNMAAMYNVQGRDTWGGAYNAEVECAIIEGYWHPGETTFDAPDVAQHNKASWLPVPSSRKGVKVQGAGGHIWTMFKDSKNPSAMFTVGEFMNTQEPCNFLWERQGWLPAVKSFIDSVDPNKYSGLDFYFRSMNEATEWSSPARCEITAFVSNEYLALKESVIRNEMTPEQAADEFQKRCVTEYKNTGFGS
jgi:maltose-binding protein MalE